jgi:hypothetical protein
MGEVNTRLPSSTCPKVFGAFRNVTRVPAGNRGCLETFWQEKSGIEPKITCRF